MSALACSTSRRADDARDPASEGGAGIGAFSRSATNAFTALNNRPSNWLTSAPDWLRISGALSVQSSGGRDAIRRSMSSAFGGAALVVTTLTGLAAASTVNRMASAERNSLIGRCDMGLFHPMNEVPELSGQDIRKITVPAATFPFATRALRRQRFSDGLWIFLNRQQIGSDDRNRTRAGWPGRARPW